MKGVISVEFNDDITIYIRALNIQGIYEETYVRKGWNEILNKKLGDDNDNRWIIIKEYSINDNIMTLQMNLRKSTGHFRYKDLKLKNIPGSNKYIGNLKFKNDPLDFTLLEWLLGIY